MMATIDVFIRFVRRVGGRAAGTICMLAALATAGCAAGDAATAEPESGRGRASGSSAEAAAVAAADTPQSGVATADSPPGAAPPADTAQAARTPDVIFVPTPDSVVVAMLRVAGVSESSLVYDLGSGDGRIVIAAASRFGARGVGIDIDPQRISEARAGAKKAGVDDRVTFILGDLFESDIHEATAVTLYLLPELNRRLRPRLFDQLKPGTPVVSHGFEMGEWTPDSTFKVEGRDVYFWVIPANVGGSWTWSAPRGSGVRDARMELRQKFQEVTGSVDVNGTKFEIVEHNLRGDSLRFTGRGTVKGAMVTLDFAGRARGDELGGTMEVTGGPYAGRQTWTARRKSPQEEIAPMDSIDAARGWSTWVPGPVGGDLAGLPLREGWGDPVIRAFAPRR